MVNFKSISEVVKEIQVPSWRIKYAHAVQDIPEPEKWQGKRVYTPEHVEELRRYFANRPASKRGPKCHRTAG